MSKWNVYAYLNEIVEADSQNEAEEIGAGIVSSDVRAEEIFEEGEEEGG